MKITGVSIENDKIEIDGKAFTVVGNATKYLPRVQVGMEFQKGDISFDKDENITFIKLVSRAPPIETPKTLGNFDKPKDENAPPIPVIQTYEQRRVELEARKNLVSVRQTAVDGACSVTSAMIKAGLIQKEGIESALETFREWAEEKILRE